MSQIESQFSDELGPKQGQVASIQFDTNSSERELSYYLGVNPAGKFLTMIASTSTLYYAFSDGGAVTINENTHTVGSSARCAMVPAGVRVRERVTGTHLTIKGSGAGILRFWISSS